MKEKLKLAQTSIFIVIAICIICAIIIIFFVQKDNSSNINEEKTSADTLAVNNFVLNCIKQTSEEAIIYVGNTGGYVNPPELSFDSVSYYFYNNTNYILKKSDIEANISSYIDNLLYVCLNDFSSFTDFNIDYGNVKSKTNILDTSVIINVNFPMSLTKLNKTYFLKDFETEIPVRLGTIYNVNKEIIDEQMKNKEAICFSCLTEISRKNNVTINLFDSGNSSILFLINDPLSTINERSYNFYFVNKYEKRV